MYYLRSKPAADPIKFTLDVESLLKDAGDIHIERKKLLNKANKSDEFGEYEKENDEPMLKKKVKKDINHINRCDVMKDEEGNEYEVCLNCGS